MTPINLEPIARMMMETVFPWILIIGLVMFCILLMVSIFKVALDFVKDLFKETP